MSDYEISEASFASPEKQNKHSFAQTARESVRAPSNMLSMPIVEEDEDRPMSSRQVARDIQRRVSLKEKVSSEA